MSISSETAQKGRLTVIQYLILTFFDKFCAFFWKSYLVKVIDKTLCLCVWVCLCMCLWVIFMIHFQVFYRSDRQTIIPDFRVAALLSIELRYSTRVFSKQIFGNLFLSSDRKFLITVAWISEVEFRNLKLEIYITNKDDNIQITIKL